MADFEVKENINLGGNKLKNAGFEVFATLPTTYKGEQITYANKVYTWNGTKYANNENYFAETSPSDTAGRWTVNIPGITELYNGLQIKIALKTPYDSTYNTLNINGLGQVLVWWRVGSRLTSHFSTGSILNLTYYSGAGTYSTFTGGWVIDYAYYSDTVTTNNVSQFRPLAGELINSYKIGMLGLDDKFYPFTKENSTGTTKTVQTVAFKLNSPIFWFYSGGQIALDSRLPSLCTMLYEGILLYTLNQTFAAYTDLYLVGVANVDNNTFVLDNSSYTSWCTNTLPTTDNGKAYMYLGKTYSSGSTMHLFEWHPVYYYKDGALRILNTNYVAPNDILTKVKTVDGSGSGLDADLLDGKHASDFITSVTKTMVEAVLTGIITSHQHNYTTSTDVSNLINTAIASVYKPKGNIANKTALLALTNIKQGDVYNAQSAFTLNGQNVKAGDNIVCLSDAATSEDINWDNLGGNIDFAAALSQALVGFSATSGNISSSNTILEAINRLAYDKHTHSNKTILDDITAAFTTALKNNYDTAYTNSHTHNNKTVLDALTQAIIDNSHTHSNPTALGAVSGTNTGDETAQRIGTLIDNATEKTTPVDADMVGLMDSAASKIMKKLSWANIKTKLKAYFDTLYALTGHNHDAVYLGKTAQAVDSDKLDGKHATDFAGISDNFDFNSSVEPTQTGTSTQTLSYGIQYLLKGTKWLYTNWKSLFSPTSAGRIQLSMMQNRQPLINGSTVIGVNTDLFMNLIPGTNITLTPGTSSGGILPVTIAATGGGGSLSQVQVDFNITDVADVRHILNKPAENRTVSNRISTLVNRKFQVNPGTASGSYNEGIRIANSSQGYSLIALGVDAALDTGVNADGNQWHIIKYPSGDIAICQGSDMGTGLLMEKGGDIYWRNTKLNSSGGSIAYMGNLEDLENGIDLQLPGDVGVWALIPGQQYFNTPNPICGTDADSSKLAGTYTYVANDGGGTWTYHDQNTNKMYISSWYIDPVNGETLNPWKRLLTCADEIATEPEEINPYEYVINSTNQHIYIDSNNFDFKSDKIIIDLTAYTSYIGMKINIGIHFNPDTGNPVDIRIVDTNNKYIQFGSSNVYTDPLTIGNTYWIEYTIYNLLPYWLVGNRIYS